MISVIIPTYNEITRKKEMINHLDSIDDFFNKRNKDYELIIVLDGPTDGTREFLIKHLENNKNSIIIDRKINKGKGFSIREGMLSAKGEIILFTDMDGATPIHMLDNFLQYFDKNTILIGSRDIDKNSVKKHQPKWKELFGDLGNLLIQYVLDLKGIKDTQCGFKVFSKQAVKEIMPRTTVSRWGIDFEILIIGKKLGYKIKEIPVEWHDSGESLVGISGYLNTLKDLFNTKIKLLKGVYKLNEKF